MTSAGPAARRHLDADGKTAVPDHGAFAELGSTLIRQSIAAGIRTVEATIDAKSSFTARNSGIVGKRLGCPNADPKEVEAARRELANGTGCRRPRGLWDPARGPYNG